MKTIGCPDLPGHRAIHNEILDLLDEHLGGTTALGDVEYLSKLMSDRYLDHIVEHDLKMAEFVTQFVARFRTPPGAA